MLLELATISQRIDVTKLADLLGTDRAELAATAGLRLEDFSRDEHTGVPAIQDRLRDMASILDRVAPRFGSAAAAYTWYRSMPLPGLASSTAMDLVNSGRASDVLDYLSAVDAGVFS